ncbi:MAG TPA: ATP-binding protein [Gemmatimonadales bacterium]
MFLTVLAAGFPAVLLGVLLLWLGDFELKTRWTFGLFAVGAWIAGAVLVRERVIRPLQTLSNLIAALGEQDYSIRARDARPTDALGLAYWEVNALTDILHTQRLEAIEATALLSKVIAEIDVAIFAFDGGGRLRLVNRAGERLLHRTESQSLGRTAGELHLAEYLTGATARVTEIAFPGKIGRWEIRRSTFRQGGLPHTLLVLNDLSTVLREEERQAWRRLVRVLSHEINNSLAPIKSIADSLSETIARSQPQPDSDLQSGLHVIASRAESLRRFMASYARLARLPAPTKRPVQVDGLVRRVVGLETRRPVEIVRGPAVTVEADPDQLEQVLINLVSNAVEALEDTGGTVRVGWERGNGHVELRVDDNGPGLPDPANLFVPFFTTKPQGSGIGLVLSRQIVEAHGGTLTVTNHRDGPGCSAVMRVPST